MCLQFNNKSKYNQSKYNYVLYIKPVYVSTIDGSHNRAYHKNIKDKFKSYTSRCVFV